MKLIVAIVNSREVKDLTESLSRGGLPATRIEGQGVFLGKHNNVFLIGTEAEKVRAVIEIIKRCCETKNEHIAPTPQAMEPGELIIPEAEKIKTSGAVIFVVEADEFYKL